MNANTTARRRTRQQPARLWRVPVSRTELITPRMARITVSGAELADFPAAGADQHVLLYLYEPGTELPEPLTVTTARNALAKVRPNMRSYTVRRYDQTAQEIDFDFVLHEHDGPASAWAKRAAVGDELIFVGPSPAYQPDPSAAAHLLIGDETALPAIGSIMAGLPDHATVLAVIEVADAAEQQRLDTAATAHVTWLHRDGRQAGSSDLLVAALAETNLPTGRIDIWAAGERTAMAELRRYLVADRGFDRGLVRPSSYWRAGQPGS
jgi:NADPH-dependent ferric siderophore reductase